MNPSRRFFLLSAGALALSATLPMRVALAQTGGEQRFVLVLLRGALDGLGAVPPLGDPDYRRQRGSLAFEPGEVLALDGFYGLNPALPQFGGWYRDREALVLHAVSTPYRERSHFDGQDLLENGSGEPRGARDGWLNRALASLGSSEGLGLAASQEIPLIMRGGGRVITWTPGGPPPVDEGFLDRVADLYSGDPLLSQALAEGRETASLAADALGDEKSRLRGVALLAQGVGQLLAEERGPRVAVMELEGWDTHQGQGTVTGRLQRALRQLDTAFASLRQGLGPAWDKTVVVTATEFGRTARVNGSGGTDHGTATCAFVAGGPVAGGRVVADWPGLADAALYQDRDLAPTLDLRAVMKGLLAEHMGLGTQVLASEVFPDSGGVKPLSGLIGA